MKFPLNLGGPKKKIKIIMHAFCDKEDFNAQNLNAREIAYRLNPDIFEATLFYRTQPDERLSGRENIHLVRVPDSKNKLMKFVASFSILKHFLGKCDIFFYVRTFRLDHLYFQVKKILGDKKITVHTVENVVPYAASERYNRIAKENALSSDYVYSVSKYVAETVEKNYGIKTPVIHVGVDTEVFKPMVDKKTKNNGKLMVLYVGSFQQRKRPYLVIEAAKYFPNVEFHLIGSGPLKSSLVETKTRLKTPNVYIHDNVPLEKLVSWMQKADIFLFPSIHEGFPKVTIEAAATGLPSIVFKNYKPETVLNGETGYIVGDVDEMMEKLEILIEDVDLRHKMGVRAREYAKKFDWNIIVKKWESEFINFFTVQTQKVQYRWYYSE